MSTYIVLSLMIQFGLLIIAVITVSSSKDKKSNPPSFSACDGLPFVIFRSAMIA